MNGKSVAMIAASLGFQAEPATAKYYVGGITPEVGNASTSQLVVGKLLFSVAPVGDAMAGGWPG